MITGQVDSTRTPRYAGPSTFAYELLSVLAQNRQQQATSGHPEPVAGHLAAPGDVNP